MTYDHLLYLSMIDINVVRATRTWSHLAVTRKRLGSDIMVWIL
jgi:hypothetical protein